MASYLVCIARNEMSPARGWWAQFVESARESETVRLLACCSLAHLVAQYFSRGSKNLLFSLGRYYRRPELELELELEIEQLSWASLSLSLSLSL